jgi:hypothetical protein
MLLHGPIGDAHPARDLPVRQALCGQGQNLALALSQRLFVAGERPVRTG